MRKNLRFLGILLVLFIATFGTHVRAQGNEDSVLYISSTYTFTENIDNPIAIMGDNMLINGSGHMLLGSEEGTGISIDGKYNITIVDLTILGWDIGIQLEDAWDIRIEDNEILGNKAEGLTLKNVSNAIISENLILDNDKSGVLLKSVSGTEISKNFISENSHGLNLESSVNNSIVENIISDNGVITIQIGPSEQKTANGGGAVRLEGASNNTIANNYLEENGFGIEIIDSGNNVIYKNAFHNNLVQASDNTPSTNDWYDTKRLEGNFWSDYAGKDDGIGTGKHAIGEDGIGDSNIPWPSPNFDFYPLMDDPTSVKRQSNSGEITIPGFDQGGILTPAQAMIGMGLGFGLVFAVVAVWRKRK